MQYPKLEKFERVQASKFSGMPPNVLYHLHDVQSINTKVGQSFYSIFRDKGGTDIVSWLPNSILKKLEKMGEKNVLLFQNVK